MSQGDFDNQLFSTNCILSYDPFEITDSTTINTIVCKSQHYHLVVSSEFSGFTVSVTQTSAIFNDLLMLIVSICNSSEVLNTTIFSSGTNYSLYWNGIDHRSQLNLDYCFEISSIASTNDVIGVPINIEFELIRSVVVLDFSNLTVDGNILFETSTLLVMINLRDQWNHTVTETSVAILNEDGIVVGYGTTQLIYNATLQKGQFLSRRTLYLNNTDARTPHTEFHGNISISDLVQLLTYINQVISRTWLFGLFTALLAIVVTIILYQLGWYVIRRYNRMKLLVQEREREIELLTDLWKIDETEIEWIEHISQGRSVKISLVVISHVFHQGGYGEVWKCEWREHVVAVKKLLNPWIAADSNNRFQEEIKFLQTVRHTNIVLFYGAGELKVTLSEF